jgi:hypothetical protein
LGQEDLAFDHARMAGRERTMLLDGRLDLGLDHRLVRHEGVCAAELVEQVREPQVLALLHVLVEVHCARPLPLAYQRR